MSGLIQKAKDAVHNVTHKDETHNTTATHGSTNAGPHNTNVANSADPRVDSNLDGGSHMGMNQTTHTTGHPSTTGTHTAGTHTAGTHTAGTHTAGTHTAGAGNTTHGSTTAGPHNSNLLNKLDPRVDSDLSGGSHAGMNQTTHPATGHATTGTHTTTGHSAGTTGIGGTTHNTTHGSTNAGPHNSNVMNTMDPRVDSDLSGGSHMGMNQTTHPTTGHHATTGTHTAGHTGHTGTTGIGGTTHNTTHGSTNAGPHNSNLLNKIDPRVDSNLDGGRHAGMNQTTHPATGHPTTTGTHTAGHTGHTGTTGIGGTTHNTTHGSTNAGPHNSNALNAMDPRVDSDLSGGSHMGMNQTTHHTTGNTHTAGHTGTTGIGGTTHSHAGHTGTTGIGGTTHNTTHGSTNAGPHNSNAMNTMDPRVDSDLSGGSHMGMNQTTHASGHPTTTGTHPAGTSGSTNAGPHKSNLLNKLDPRVDSDLSGGSHAGMNQTTHTNY